MEKLDDYIKTILEQSQPTYSDEYWKQTSLFIEEKRKKRIFWFFWFFSGLIVVLIGGGSLFLFLNHSKPDHAKSKQNFNHMATIQIENENSDPILIESKTNQNINQLKKTNLSNIAQSGTISNNNALFTKNDITSTSENSALMHTPIDLFHSAPLMNENQPHFPESIIDQVELNQNAQHTNLELLSLPFRIEFYGDPVIEISTLQAAKDIVAQQPHSSLGYYFDLAGIMNPVFHPDQKWSLGLSGGFGINVDIKQKLSLQAGVSYLHRWGTFNVMIDHPTPIYDFAKDDRGYSLVPTDAGYLTFPLSVGIPIGKYSIGIGINSMRLLGAKGNVFEYEGLPVENEPDKVVYRSTQISSGWIETPGFRKWVFEYNLYMERKLNTHLNVGMRFGYLPKGLVKSDYNFYFDHESMNYIERETAGLLENNYHLTIYMNYRL